MRTWVDDVVTGAAWIVGLTLAAGITLLVLGVAELVQAL